MIYIVCELISAADGKKVTPGAVEAVLQHPSAADKVSSITLNLI